MGLGENTKINSERSFQEHSDLSGSGNNDDFNNYHVLVIDNDPMILKLFEKYLQTWGFKPLLANDPYEGIALAVKYRPMAVILDVIMPEIDGKAVLRLLKKIETTSDIPVILLSTEININLINEAWRDGAADFLAKPFSYDTLYRKIAGAINPEVTPESVI